MEHAVFLTNAHVLVVDDEPTSAGHIGRILKELGHRPTLCHSWMDAIRAFGAGDPDIVLMDAVMPTVDGFKLTKLLRARASSYVPIVFVTALADHGAREHGVAVGADDFITKPVDPLELKVRLMAMLRIRHLTRDLEAKTRALTRLASIDALTGLGNRRTFDERLSREVEGSRDPLLTVLLADIDHFKVVNDTYGHAVGDELLSIFGTLLGQLTRSCDIPFRYGGEEFAVIATGTGSTHAMHLAERIRRAFAERTSAATRCGRQTLSIGYCGTDQFASYPKITDLLQAADLALYRAKANGRNCVCKYDPTQDIAAADRAG